MLESKRIMNGFEIGKELTTDIGEAVSILLIRS
jgi:hypothetical protein